MDDVTPEVELLDIYRMCNDMFGGGFKFGQTHPAKHNHKFRAFCDALCAALGTHERAVPVREAAGAAYTWPLACHDAATVAVKQGLPAATVNFLAVLHLKG